MYMYIQQCIRMLDDEPTRDFKSMMRRQWRRIPPEFLDEAANKPLELRALTFATVCLHALLSARYRFGGRGWTGGSVGLGLGYGGGYGSSNGDPLLVVDNSRRMVQGDSLNWGSIRAAVYYNLLGGRHRSNVFDERALCE
jgi:hypothetical protein